MIREWLVNVTLPISVQGKWFRGIVDELQRDPGSGAVSFVEHKTRHRPSTPGQLQQDTARLQLMLYRALLAGLRNMPSSEVRLYFVRFHCGASPRGFWRPGILEVPFKVCDQWCSGRRYALLPSLFTAASKTTDSFQHGPIRHLCAIIMSKQDVSAAASCRKFLVCQSMSSDTTLVATPSDCTLTSAAAGVLRGRQGSAAGRVAR